MRHISRAVQLVFFFSVLLLVCGTWLFYASVVGPRLTLLWLTNANAKSDVDSAIRRGDFRLVYISGFAPIAPGTETIDFNVQHGCQFWGVPFTSDAVSSRTIGQLNELGYKYAEEYNRRLIQKVGAAAICSNQK